VGTNAPVGQTSLHELGLPWSVQVFLLDVEKLDIDQQQQFRSYLWIVGIVLIAIVAFAILAISIVNRQIELRDLRSTAVATVAHELRTPLASMRMLVDTLREGRYRGETQLTEYLALIAQENERLARLANDFLTFTQLERGTQRLDIQRIPPRAAIDQTLAALRPRLEAAAFTLNVPESLPAILADRDAPRHRAQQPARQRAQIQRRRPRASHLRSATRGVPSLSSSRITALASRPANAPISSSHFTKAI